MFFFWLEVKIMKLGDLTTWRKSRPPPPQPFYGPFSGTTRVSRCQKRTSWLNGARED